jgi:hypothetical protein
MKLSEKLREKKIPSFVGRLCVFLFSVVVLLSGLFLLGNFQEFLDSTQVFLLSLLRIATLTFIIVAVYHLLVLTVHLMRKGQVSFFAFLFSVLGMVIVGLIYFLVNFLSSWLD